MQSSFQDAGWLRRLRSLALPGRAKADEVQNVNIVNDRSYASSRERAPYAFHTVLVAAPGAGVHNFVEITGVDSLGVAPEKLLHRMFVQLPPLAGQDGAALSIANLNGAALTTATRVATTPMLLEADPELTPQLFIGTITTANLPATRANLPLKQVQEGTNATPEIVNCNTWLEPLVGLPFALRWRENSIIFFWENADTLGVIELHWQIFRA